VTLTSVVSSIWNNLLTNLRPWAGTLGPRPLGMGCDDRLETRVLAHLSYAKFRSFDVKPHEPNGDPKIWPIASRLIQGHWNRHGSIGYRLKQPSRRQIRLWTFLVAWTVVAPVHRRSVCTPIKSSAILLPPWIVDRVPPPVPALFPRLHLYLHLPAVPVDVHVHPVLECLLRPKKKIVVSGNPTDPSFYPPTLKILWTYLCWNFFGFNFNRTGF